MRNGVVDSIVLMNICKLIDKIIILRRKYNNNDELIEIDENISLKFIKRFKVCYLCINGEQVIKYNYGYIAALIKGGISGLSLGTVKSYVSFIKKDKVIISKEFLQKIERRMEHAISKIEMQLDDKLKEKRSME